MKNDNTNKKAETAEFPDDAEIDFDVDHDAASAFNVVDADPNYRYFLAADDGDKDRPDGVFQCKQMGYRECRKETATGGTDCKLMRIPRKVFDARKQRKVAAREAARKRQPKDLVRMDDRINARKDEARD